RHSHHDSFRNRDPCLLQQFLRLILMDLHSYSVLLEEKHGTLAASSAGLSITRILFTARHASIPGGRSQSSPENQSPAWSSATPASPLARPLPYHFSARSKSCRRPGHGRFLGAHRTW